MGSPSDVEQPKELVELAKGGDASALERLCGEYRGMVHSICMRWTRNPTDADELTQDALLRALTHLDQLQEPERFPGWLATIAGNVCRNYLMREKRETVPLDESWRSSPEPESPEVGAVREILASLPSEVRSAMEMFYIDGLTRKELASLLHVPESTVQSRINSGCRVMRREFEAMGFSFETRMLDEDVVIPNAKALIADPDKTAAKERAGLLRSHGFTCSVSNDLGSVLGRVKRERPGILIVSEGREIGSAFDVIGEMKVSKSLRSTSIMLLLPRPAPEEQIYRAWVSGVDCCLTSPVDPDEFVSFIGRIDAAIKASGYCELAIEHAWRRETDKVFRYLRRAAELPDGRSAIAAVKCNLALNYLYGSDELRALVGDRTADDQLTK